MKPNEKELIQIATKLEFYTKLNRKIEKVMNGELGLKEWKEEVCEKISKMEGRNKSDNESENELVETCKQFIQEVETEQKSIELIHGLRNKVAKMGHSLTYNKTIKLLKKRLD